MSKVNPYYFVGIHLDQCKNETDSKVICKSQDDIEEFFRDVHLYIMFPEAYFMTTEV